LSKEYEMPVQRFQQNQEYVEREEELKFVFPCMEIVHAKNRIFV